MGELNSTPPMLQGCMAVVSLSLTLESLCAFRRWGIRSKGSGECGKVRSSKLGGGSVPSAEARRMAGVVCLLLRVCAVVLSLLLMAGDIERNPGPTDKEGYDQVEKLLPNVDDSPLGENDLFDVLAEMMPLVANWKAIGRGFRIDSGHLDQIQSDNHGDSRECLSGVLTCWLKKNYNVELHGKPSWRTVVKVVGHSAAGSNCALAKSIAEKHSVVAGTTSIRSHDLCPSSTASDGGASVSPRPSSSTSTQMIAVATPQSSVRSREDSCVSSTMSDDVFTSEGASVSPRCRPSSSSQSEGSEKPPFGCGCGKCTFYSYYIIESGCPSPNPSARMFPYLDLSGLTDEQIETLKSRLRVESREIVLKFEQVKSVAMRSLMRQGVTVDALLDCLTILKIFDPVMKDPTSPNCYTDLMNAKTIPKVFIALSNYVSFFNYDIIDRIITELGTEEDKQELQKYEDDFQMYAKRKIYKCFPQVGPVSETDYADLFVKVDSFYESYTMVELRDFQSRLSKLLLRIPSQGVLRLCRIEKGCFQLMFQVPLFVQQKIFPLSSEQERALVAEGVIKLTCGNYEFVTKGEEGESEPEDTEPVTELRGPVFQLALTRHDFDTDSAMGVSIFTSLCTFATDEEGEEDESEPEDTEPVAELRGPVFQPALTRHDIDTDSAVGTSVFTDDKSSCTFATDEEDPLYNELEELEYTLHSHESPSEASSEHHGTTELHRAAWRGDLETVRLLTEEKHENPLQKDKKGDTALHVAARGGSLDVLKYFVSEKNYNPACAGSHGRTPLHYASYEGHLNVVRYLVIEQQVDPLCQDEDGRTPLHFCCSTGDLGIVTVLTEEIEKYNPIKDSLANLKDKHERSPLNVAVLYGNLNIAKFFISEKYCSPNIPGQYGRIPLHTAVDRGHLHIVKYLIDEQGCDPSCLDRHKSTPLHHAACKGHLDIVKFLTLEKRCNPNQRTIFNNTPLHLAAEKGHLRVVQFFVEVLKCPPNLRNKYNMTPHLDAKARGHLNVALYLQKIERSN